MTAGCWLPGDADALTVQEKEAYKLFKASGCTACHNGPAVGGNSIQKLGVVEAYQTNNKAEGVAALTGKDADRFKFKVSTLLNVEMTYPGKAGTAAQYLPSHFLICSTLLAH